MEKLNSLSSNKFLNELDKFRSVQRQIAVANRNCAVAIFQLALIPCWCLYDSQI
jgi:hypothetical protein